VGPHDDLFDFDGLTWAFCAFLTRQLFQCFERVLTPTSLRIQCACHLNRGGAKCDVRIGSCMQKYEEARDCAGWKPYVFVSSTFVSHGDDAAAVMLRAFLGRTRPEKVCPSATGPGAGPVDPLSGSSVHWIRNATERILSSHTP